MCLRKGGETQQQAALNPSKLGAKAVQDDHISPVDRFVLKTTNERLVVFG
jgi:hypothetical protein